jgi:hypothetical protein
MAKKSLYITFGTWVDGGGALLKLSGNSYLIFLINIGGYHIVNIVNNCVNKYNSGVCSVSKFRL